MFISKHFSLSLKTIPLLASVLCLHELLSVRTSSHFDIFMDIYHIYLCPSSFLPLSRLRCLINMLQKWQRKSSCLLALPWSLLPCWNGKQLTTSVAAIFSLYSRMHESD